MAQILSVADSNSQPLHIELDSAATISYITLAEVKKRRFCIKPNNLGDSLTPLNSTERLMLYFTEMNIH